MLAKTRNTYRWPNLNNEHGRHSRLGSLSSHFECAASWSFIFCNQCVSQDYGAAQSFCTCACNPCPATSRHLTISNRELYALLLLLFQSLCPINLVECDSPETTIRPMHRNFPQVKDAYDCNDYLEANLHSRLTRLQSTWSGWTDTFSATAVTHSLVKLCLANFSEILQRLHSLVA